MAGLGNRGSIGEMAFMSVDMQPLSESIWFQFVYCPIRTKSDMGIYVSDNRPGFPGESEKEQASGGMILVCWRSGARASIQSGIGGEYGLDAAIESL